MLYKLFSLLLLICATIVVIGYARGYRFNLTDRNVNSTGIIAVNSNPRDAKLFINDKLYGYTDLRINVKPGVYQITLDKEGYFSWAKTIVVKGEVVYNFYPTLFSQNATLYPLTSVQIARAITVDSPTTKVLCIGADLGAYIYTPDTRILRLNDALTTIISPQFGSSLDLLHAEYHFSPDGKKALVYMPPLGTESVRDILLLDLETLDTYTPIVDDNAAASILSTWEQSKQEEHNTLLTVFPDDFVSVATNSAHIVSFSSDKSKIVYKATSSAMLKQPKKVLLGVNQSPESRSIDTNLYYLYDRKEFRNYLLGPDQPVIHPNSKNLLFFDENSIRIADFDGQNEHVVYSGPYDPEFVSLTTMGKLLILTNLNPKILSNQVLYQISF